MATAPKDTVKIMINSSPDGDTSDVFLAHNFDTILVKRNIEVDLPIRFLESLKGSRVTTKRKDPETGKETEITMQSIPYSVVA